MTDIETTDDLAQALSDRYSGPIETHGPHQATITPTNEHFRLDVCRIGDRWRVTLSRGRTRLISVCRMATLQEACEEFDRQFRLLMTSLSAFFPNLETASHDDPEETLQDAFPLATITHPEPSEYRVMGHSHRPHFIFTRDDDAWHVQGSHPLECGVTYDTLDEAIDGAYDDLSDRKET
jgi:hypothetical protein